MVIVTIYRSGRGGKWRSSWWVLQDKVMFRFSAAEDIVAQETIPVLGWSLETLSDVSAIFFLFQIEKFKSNYNWGKCPRYEARKK